MNKDGDRAEAEMRMLHATVAYLGLSESDFIKLSRTPLSYTPPKKPMDRIVQFYQMAILVNADGEQHHKELEYLKWLSLKMGLRQEAADAIMKRMETNATEVLSPEEVISIFQVFHN